MAIEKQPKSNVPIDTNQLVNNILQKVSHIVSLGRDIPRKELVELRDMYEQFRHADKLAIVEVLPNTIDKLYKSVNLVSPITEKPDKTRINLNELAQGEQKGIEQVAQVKIDDDEQRKLEQAIDYSIDDSIKNINAILDVDAEAGKVAQVVGDTEKINKNLAEITSQFLQRAVKVWIGIEHPDVEFTKADIGIPEFTQRTVKEEVLADSRESVEARLAGEGILKPEKEAYPIGTFPEYVFKSQQDLDLEREKEVKTATDLVSDVEHEIKEATETQDSVEHEVKEAQPAPDDTTREEKGEEELVDAGAGEEKELHDISPEVYEIEKARRRETEEDIDDTTLTPEEKETLAVNENTLSDTSREVLTDSGLREPKRPDRSPDGSRLTDAPEAEDPVEFLSKKYRQVGWMEGLSSFFSARVLNQGDPRTINYQVPQNKEMTNLVTGVTAQPHYQNIAGIQGFNIDAGGIARVLAGAATIFPPFGGTTTAEIAKAIITIQRKINTQINAFELAVAWELINFYREFHPSDRTTGGYKPSVWSIHHKFTTEAERGTLITTLDSIFANFTTDRMQEENRKLKGGDQGIDAEGDVRLIFSSSSGGDQDGAKDQTENADPFILSTESREHDSHKFYNKTQHLLKRLGKHCTGYLKVYLRRGPKWEGEAGESDEDMIQYIPFQFEPEVSGDGKRASYSQLQTLARSQPAYAYRNSEARSISMTVPYLVTGMTEEQRNASSLIAVGKSGSNPTGLYKMTKSGGNELLAWTEDFIYNYVIRWYRQLTLPNFPEGTKFRLAPPLMQVWYGGLVVPEDSHLKVSSTGSITGSNIDPSEEFVEDSANELMADVPPMFRTNWYLSGTTYRTYRSLWIASGVSFDYKYGFINARTKNRIGVDVKLDLVEIGPGVTENEVLKWRKYSKGGVGTF